MSAENATSGKLFEIGEKLVHNARYMIPAVGLFYLLRDLWIYFWNLLGEWLEGIIEDFLGKVLEAIGTLGIDLTPPPAFLAFIAKANSVVPLDEAWRLLVVYLAFASVVMGVKWSRNLTPGMS